MKEDKRKELVKILWDIYFEGYSVGNNTALNIKNDVPINLSTLHSKVEEKITKLIKWIDIYCDSRFT